MRANAICSAAVLTVAAPVFGAALHGRRQAIEYQVSEFTGSCIPHSLYCVYDFFLTAAGSSSSEEPTHCSVITQGPDLLPAVDTTGCEDAAYSWSVALVPGNSSSLGVTVTSALDAQTNLTGVHLIGKDQLAMESHETAISQYYKGPKNFTVGAESIAVL